VLHCLRLLELLGRTDVPVISGAAMPWSGSPAIVKRWEALYGNISWKGAFGLNYTAFEVFPEHFPEGLPTTQPLNTTAAQFIVKTVQSLPDGTVTLLALGPMTNFATAITLDPSLPGRVKEFVVSGGALDCGQFENDRQKPGKRCDMSNRPKFEFNMWFDALAADFVFRSERKVIPYWTKLSVVPVDISSTLMWSDAMRSAIQSNCTTRAANYLNKYVLSSSVHSSDVAAASSSSPDFNFPMFDEGAVIGWLYPEIYGLGGPSAISYFIAVDTSEGAGGGDTLTWPVSGPTSIPTGLGQNIASSPSSVSIDIFQQRYLDLVFLRA